MIIKCGINGEDQHDSRIFVCHHCGMPVCEEHGWVVASDDAFAGSATAVSAPPGAAPPSGVMTPPPGAAGPPPGVPAPRTAMTVPRPAMHCRDCVDRFHRRAVKRHGWADPALLRMPGPVNRP